MAQVTTELITGEELFEMSDIGPCELVKGRTKKITPTGWKHGGIETKIGRYLDEFVEQESLGAVMVGEVGIYTRRDPDTVRGADVLFVSEDRLQQASADGFLDVAPELVVEIMSPSNTWEEVRRKIEEYFAIGVDRVWIVEPENRSVLIFRSVTGVEKREKDDVLEGEGKLEGFALPVAALFAH